MNERDDTDSNTLDVRFSNKSYPTELLCSAMESTMTFSKHSMRDTDGASRLEELFNMFAEDGMNRVNGDLVGHLLRSMGYSLPQRWIEEYLLPHKAGDDNAVTLNAEQLSSLMMSLVEEEDKEVSNKACVSSPLDVGMPEGQSSSIHLLYRTIREVSNSLGKGDPFWGHPMEHLVCERTATWDPRTSRGTRSEPAPTRQEVIEERGKLYTVAKRTLEWLASEVDKTNIMFTSLREDLKRSLCMHERMVNRELRTLGSYFEENLDLIAARLALRAEMESLEEIYSQTRAKQKGDETAFLEDKERHIGYLEMCAERKRACEESGDLLAKASTELLEERKIRSTEYSKLVQEERIKGQLEGDLRLEEHKRQLLLGLLQDVIDFIEDGQSACVATERLVRGKIRLIQGDLQELVAHGRQEPPSPLS